MRRLARQILDLLRQTSWQRKNGKVRGRNSPRLQVECLEDRFLLATGVADVLPAVLMGTAFIDHNNNGVRDQGELALPGATITLTGDNGVTASAVTDSNGAYRFLQVAPGTYQLNLSAAGTFLAGTPGLGNDGGVRSGSGMSSIVIGQGQTLVNYNLAVEGIGPGPQGLSIWQNFLASTPVVNGIPVSSASRAGSGFAFADGAPAPTGFTPPITGSLAGTVTGPGIPSVTVELNGITNGGVNAGLPVFLTTTTDSITGAYSFPTLAAGTYSLDVIQPAGFRAGAPSLGTSGGFIKQNDVIAGIDVTTIAGQNYNFVEIPVAAPAAGSTPAMEAHLADDTSGPGGLGTASDGITSDPSTAGVITNFGQVTGFQGFIVGLSSTSSNLLASVNPDGSFFLNRAVIKQMAGGTLADGPHVLRLTVFGAGGAVAGTVDVGFTLSTTAPVQPTLGLGTNFDKRTDTPGAATLNGRTSPAAHVDLISGASTMSTTAAGDGTFSFSVTLAAGGNDFTVRATDNAGNQSQLDTTIVVNRTPVGTNPAPVSASHGGADQILDLSTMFADADTSGTVIRLHTSLGKVDIQLNDGTDPQTVANFLNYINSHRFDSTFFHRLHFEPGLQVLQGGGFKFDTGTNTITPIATDPTVKNEFQAANSNVRGTVAMAKGSNPNSANSEFFFNLADDHASLDSQSFTVFGHIVDGLDQRIVDRLAAVPIQDESKAPGAAINTVQQVTLDGEPTGGTFTLGAGTSTSSPIAFDADAATVKAAVAGLTLTGASSPIGAANVDVSGGPVAGGLTSWTITFKGNLAGTSVAALTQNSTSLTGGTAPVALVTVTTPGSATNSALAEMPLQNYHGSNFPTDAAAALEIIQGAEVIRTTEALTYTVTGNTNPAAALATTNPTSNERLNLHFGAVGTTTITVTATDQSGKTGTVTISVTVN